MELLIFHLSVTYIVLLLRKDSELLQGNKAFLHLLAFVSHLAYGYLINLVTWNWATPLETLRCEVGLVHQVGLIMQILASSLLARVKAVVLMIKQR